MCGSLCYIDTDINLALIPGGPQLVLKGFLTVGHCKTRKVPWLVGT